MGTDEGLVREELRARAKASSYFLAKAVLGFGDLTPRTHKPMCEWMDASPRRALALAPRSTFKSTILTMTDTIRRIINDPNIRILIVSGSLENAQKMLRLIQEVFERNTLFQTLFPEVIPDFTKTKRWNTQEMLVPRTATWPEATVEIIGVGGMVTSRHYDVIKNDDLIGEQQAESPTEIQRAINFYRGQESLLVNVREGLIHTVGTRWAFQDPYGWMIDHEPGLATYIKSAEDRWPDGALYFPERLPQEELDRIKQKQGMYRYSALYLNHPTDPEANSFQRAWLKWHLVEADQVLPESGAPVPVASLRRFLRVDPAISERSNAARTAIVVDGMAPDETVYLLETWQKRCQPAEMFDAIFALADRWDLMDVYVEAVAYQRAIKPFLEAEAARRNRYLRVHELRPDTRKSKEARIRATQPYLERRQVSVSRAHVDFLREYEQFPFGDTVDVLDAWAYGPFVWEPPLEGESADEDPAGDLARAQYQGRSGVTGY